MQVNVVSIIHTKFCIPENATLEQAKIAFRRKQKHTI